MIKGTFVAVASCSEEEFEMNLPSFPQVDLFSAGINALNGVLVARNPSHNRGYTVAGLLIMAYFGGIGGGVSRDMLLGEIPGPLKSPIYLVVCLLMGVGACVLIAMPNRGRNSSVPGR